MNRLFYALACMALTVSAYADNGLPLTARHEVLRRGCAVEHVSGGYEGASDLKAAYFEATKPPDSDAHKWFITVWTTPGCKACESLKAAFATDETLRAWVNVDSPRDSAVHYRVISVSDATQQWRNKLAGIKAFPCVMIQPPLNGKFGDPKTCLPPIIGFTSAADEADKIRETCRAYIETYEGARPVEVATATIKNREPPFKWPDTAADDLKKTILSTTNTTETTGMADQIIKAAETLLQTFSTTGGLSLLALIAVGVWVPYRNHLKLIGQTPWLSDATYNKILALLQSEASVIAPS